METILVTGSTEVEIKEQKKGDESYGVYPQVVGLDCELFQLSNTPLTDERQQKALGQLETFLKIQQKNFLGYQVNQNIHYAEKLSFMLDMHANNAGDPFINSNYTLNTKIMEQVVLDHFANLWHAQSPSDQANKESYWGFVLSMGSTEGNIYALYNAREYLKGRALYHELDEDLPHVHPLQENAYHPVAFFSQDTHYSIKKSLRILEIRTFQEIGEEKYKGQCPITPDGCWPKEVPSENGNEGPGTIDVGKLIQLIEFFARIGFPPLIILNIGTTFKGAYDDVEEVGNRLKPMLEKYNLYKRMVEYSPDKFDERTGYWIHIDGALGASYLPFLEKARGSIRQHIPRFDFSLPFVHSIVTSGHKYFGSPTPTGIFMTKRKYQIAPHTGAEYIGSPDTTLAGSRNSLSAAVLWCYYANTSDQIEVHKAMKVEETAQYAEMTLKELDQEFQSYGYKLWVARAPLSLSIIFRDPEHRDIVSKYSLSQMKIMIDGEREPRKYAHIYIMQSVTKKLIDEFVGDLRLAYSKTFLPEQEIVVEEYILVPTINEKTDI